MSSQTFPVRFSQKKLKCARCFVRFSPTIVQRQHYKMGHLVYCGIDCRRAGNAHSSLKRSGRDRVERAKKKEAQLQKRLAARQLPLFRGGS